MTREQLTREIKERARALGFHGVGVTGVHPLEEDEAQYHRWLREGRAADLSYMHTSAAVRAHPRRVWPEARSVLVLAVNYYSGDFDPLPRGHGRIARYAWGRDYHDVIPARLRQLVAEIERLLGRPIRARWFTDAGPLLERALARRAGLGRIGWNACLITEAFGSWVFLSEILLDVELVPDQEETRACMSLFDCWRYCPTNAITRDGSVDARLCLSYHTIENRGVIPRPLRPKLGDWLFGCDVCQEVCPHNARVPITDWPEFHPEAGVGKTLALADVLAIASDEAFRARFRGTALRRAKRRGLLRNAAIVAANTGYVEAIPQLQHLVSEDPDEIIRGHALWALHVLDPVGSRPLLERARRDPHPFVREEAEWALETRSEGEVIVLTGDAPIKRDGL
ncbi:MAG: tRNA epoxyqueuosine(34) reductase QueG [Blastocatellia bacterium]|nr:tRNA epoxyqueuosine(34) reductase QueG [Blastocatellia bacterium]MCS7158127.1 tRNA epoxyqueuosine(34) reductase QueG [Blastocatellia bacterium]MCX7753010.1 tRNA epoxyqueuosine(34) reductase QueG [Blastocatellia bacterium]MDW8168533.1 tRNA epoxyqueuosine(34) reductase QueG [Acidobacteriota bacterium]MDW8256947.1 tRNA epoxyqueuosine(34) reductase QueG [Acidobacteriota bacterium]